MPEPPAWRYQKITKPMVDIPLGHHVFLGRVLTGIGDEVIDDGFGVPIENRQKVFEKFYQHGDIHTRQQGGTGLGLSIAKSIVEVHGGRIWVDDGEGGRGSNFQFVLPLVDIDEGATM